MKWSHIVKKMCDLMASSSDILPPPIEFRDPPPLPPKRQVNVKPPGPPPLPPRRRMWTPFKPRPDGKPVLVVHPMKGDS